jgi:hypothetical protein
MALPRRWLTLGPIFCVVTSPACSRTPTCFFMPVRVMWNVSASAVIEGGRGSRVIERQPAAVKRGLGRCHALAPQSGLQRIA